MNGNINNKVYINPNFKRPPLISPSPLVQPDVSNIYYGSPQQMQIKNLSKNSNRKIYVNPNFKQIKQQKESYTKVPEVCDKDENIEAYPKLISKSKYSLVANINKGKIDERNNCREGISCSSINTKDNETDILYTPNICAHKVSIDKNLTGIPIIKSRYTLVRNNNVVSENKETIKSQNREFPNRSSNFDKSYSNFNTSVFKNEINNKSKPIEKIAKIKISKYKTVPITYLTNFSLTSVKECKLNQSISQSYKNTEKSSRLEVSFKNNKYKLTRPSSKPVANIVNPSKTYIRTVNKNVWHNQSKVKLLKANFKINNIPCRLFTKYGKCLRKDYGKCEYLHDKKHVSLCRKFLKGICHDSNCPLSHELTANKMPTCFFYLKGICTKENCPYLHIKLNDKTKVCPFFMRGYCEKGDTCKFRHIKVIQQKKSKMFYLCNRLQNQSTKLIKTKAKSGIQKKNIPQINEKINIKSQNEEENNVDCRYYKEMVTNDDSCNNIKPTRCKIGTLPSFIQL